MADRDELGEYQHPGHAWQQVCCRTCRRTFTCTPEDDYYDDGHGSGADEGVCEGCLLAAAGVEGPALDGLLLEGLLDASREIVYAEAERSDEGLMLDGLDERAAVSVTNESLHPALAIAGRCQHAADIVEGERLAAAMEAALAEELPDVAPVSVSYVAQDGSLYVDGERWA